MDAAKKIPVREGLWTEEDNPHLIGSKCQSCGEAGPRQVAKAKIGLAHSMGAGGNSAVNILKH